MNIKILPKTRSKLLAKIESIKEELKINSKEIEQAADFGDLKENAEYEAAKEKQGILFSSLRRFEGYLKNGKEIIITEHGATNVCIGCHIKISETKNGFERQYLIAGPAEIDLNDNTNTISYQSPFAKAAFGKSVGDVFTVVINNRTNSYKILEINTKPIN